MQRRRRLGQLFTGWSIPGWAVIVGWVLEKVGALASIWVVLGEFNVPEFVSSLAGWLPLAFGIGWLGWLVANPRRIYHLSKLGGLESRLENETFVMLLSGGRECSLSRMCRRTMFKRLSATKSRSYRGHWVQSQKGV